VLYVLAAAASGDGEEAAPSVFGVFLGLGLLALIVIAVLAAPRVSRRRAERARRPAGYERLAREAKSLVAEVRAAAAAADEVRLAALVAPEVLTHWRPRLEPERRLQVDVVRHSGGGADVESAVVRVRSAARPDAVAGALAALPLAHLRHWYSVLGFLVPVALVAGWMKLQTRRDERRARSSEVVEYWTLRRRDGRWIVVSVDSDPP
jgi:hypothetical protein